MDVDLAGMIRNAPARGPSLLPVFEAIMNSIHAAEDREVAPTITVLLHRSGALVEDEEGPLAPIESISVIDNGSGFNTKNYRSFDTLFSRHKAEKGGKGLGRIRFLERFSSVEVQSRYFEDGNWWLRNFKFLPMEPPVTGEPPATNDAAPGWETRVTLKGLKSTFAADFPKRTATVARKIVEHFFEKFLGENPPGISVRDESSGETLDLNNLFSDEYEQDIQRRTFNINGWNFEYKGVWVGKDNGSAHEAVFCAHDRAVTSEKLASREPLLANIVGPHGHPLYRAYVSGNLLDERVDHERTSFNLDRGVGLAFSPDLPKWDDIVDLAMTEVRGVLGEFLASTRERNIETNVQPGTWVTL